MANLIEQRRAQEEESARQQLENRPSAKFMAPMVERGQAAIERSLAGPPAVEAWIPNLGNSPYVDPYSPPTSFTHPLEAPQEKPPAEKGPVGAFFRGVGGGLVSGTAGLAGETAEFLTGGHFGSALKDWSDRVVMEGMGPDEDMLGDPNSTAWENMTGHGSIYRMSKWWLYNIGSMVGTLAPMLIPGTIGARVGAGVVRGAKIAEAAEKALGAGTKIESLAQAGKVMNVLRANPALKDAVVKGAKWGSTLASAGYMGHMQGVGVYHEALKEGKTPTEAMGAYISAAGPNAVAAALPLSFILERAPAAIQGRLLHAAVSGLMGGGYGVMSPVVNEWALGHDAQEAVKQGIEMAGPAAVVGLLAGMGEFSPHAQLIKQIRKAQAEMETGPPDVDAVSNRLKANPEWVRNMAQAMQAANDAEAKAREDPGFAALSSEQQKAVISGAKKAAMAPFLQAARDAAKRQKLAEGEAKAAEAPVEETEAPMFGRLEPGERSDAVVAFRAFRYIINKRLEPWKADNPNANTTEVNDAVSDARAELRGQLNALKKDKSLRHLNQLERLRRIDPDAVRIVEEATYGKGQEVQKGQGPQAQGNVLVEQAEASGAVDVQRPVPEAPLLDEHFVDGFEEPGPVQEWRVAELAVENQNIPWEAMNPNAPAPPPQPPREGPSARERAVGILRQAKASKVQKIQKDVDNMLVNEAKVPKPKKEKPGFGPPEDIFSANRPSDEVPPGYELDEELAAFQKMVWKAGIQLPEGVTEVGAMEGTEFGAIGERLPWIRKNPNKEEGGYQRWIPTHQREKRVMGKRYRHPLTGQKLGGKQEGIISVSVPGHWEYNPGPGISVGMFEDATILADFPELYRRMGGEIEPGANAPQRASFAPVDLLFESPLRQVGMPEAKPVRAENLKNGDLVIDLNDNLGFIHVDKKGQRTLVTAGDARPLNTGESIFLLEQVGKKEKPVRWNELREAFVQEREANRAKIVPGNEAENVVQGPGPGGGENVGGKAVQLGAVQAQAQAPAAPVEQAPPGVVPQPLVPGARVDLAGRPLPSEALQVEEPLPPGITERGQNTFFETGRAAPGQVQADIEGPQFEASLEEMRRRAVEAEPSKKRQGEMFPAEERAKPRPEHPGQGALFETGRKRSAEGREQARTGNASKLRQSIQSIGLDDRLFDDADLADAMDGVRSSESLAGQYLEKQGIGAVFEETTPDGKVRLLMSPIVQPKEDPGIAAQAMFHSYGVVATALEGALAESAPDRMSPRQRQVIEIVNSTRREVDANFRNSLRYGVAGEVRDAIVTASGGRVSADEAEAATRLMYARAVAWASLKEGNTPEEWFRKWGGAAMFQGAMAKELPGLPRTATAKTTIGGKDSNALIQLIQDRNPDIVTVHHEILHLISRDIGDMETVGGKKILQVMADYLKQNGAAILKGTEYTPDDMLYQKRDPKTGQVDWVWTRSGSEAFVRMGQRIHATPVLFNKLPPFIKPVFDKMWRAFGTLWTELRYGFDISDEVRNAYFEVFNIGVQGTARAKMVEARVQSKAKHFGINPTYFSVAPHEVGVLLKLAKIYQGEKDTESWDQSLAKAAVLIQNPKEVRRIMEEVEKGSAASLTEEQVCVAIAMSHAEVEARGAQLLACKTPEDFAKVRRDIRENSFTLKFEGVKSGMGRKLNLLKLMVSDAMVIKAMEQMQLSMNKAEWRSILELRERVIEGSDPTAVEQLKDKIEATKKPVLKDYMLQCIYNGMLSNPKTHVLNALSNTLWTAYQPLFHTPISASIDWAYSRLTGKERRVFLGEMVPLIAPWLSREMWGKAMGPFWHIMKTGERPQGWERGDKMLDVTSREMLALERSGNAALRTLAPYITWPSRALRAVDALFETMGVEAYMGAQRYRAGKLGKEFDMTEAMKAAKLYARYITFTDEPGRFTRAAISMKQSMGVAGPMFIPFINTISNIAKRGLEMTPGVGVGMSLMGSRGQLGRESRAFVDHPASMMAKQVEGAILGMALVSLFANDELTGAYPTNPAERQAWARTGKIPWAFKVNTPDGAMWIQYIRIEPFSLALGSACEFGRFWRNLQNDLVNPERRDSAMATATKRFEQMALDVSTYLVDNSWADGIANLLDRHTGKMQGLARSLGALVPYSGAMRQVANWVDALKNEGYVPQPDAEGALSTLIQVVPITRTFLQVPQRVNVWGEPLVVSAEGLWRSWLPIKASPAKLDPIELEFDRLNRQGLSVYPGMPLQTHLATIQEGRPKVPIPDDLYRQFIIGYGVRGKEAVRRIMESGRYQRLPATWEGDRQRVLLVDKALDKIRSREEGKLRRAMLAQGLRAR